MDNSAAEQARRGDRLGAFIHLKKAEVADAIFGPVSGGLAGNCEDDEVSFGQERLWIYHQIEPAARSSYNVPFALQLTGDIDPGLVKAALKVVVSRHDVLRTLVVTAPDGTPSLRSCESEINVKFGDFSKHQEARSEAARFIGDELANAIDPASEILRVHLIRVAPQEWLLFAVIHHIAFDGWSAGLMAREFLTAYDALKRGVPPQLPELPIRYGDYARWQRRALSSSMLDEQLAFWRQKLANAPEPAELPADFPIPSEPTFEGDSVCFELSTGMAESFERFCREEKFTPYMVFLATFQALLGRWTGADDIIVGSPVSGRMHQQMDNVIGFFVNTLPMRADLSNGPSFRTLLDQVRAFALEAYGSQEVPFEKIIEALNLPRTSGRTPLVQATLTLQGEPEPLPDVAGLTAEWHEIQRRPFVKFDLAMHIESTGTSYKARLDFATDLFRRTTAERFATHFQNFLRAAISDPNQSIRRIKFLSEKEHQFIRTISGADTSRSLRQSLSAIDRIYDYARRSADRTAIVDNTGTFTYSELVKLIDRVSERLKQVGVGPGAIVGVEGARQARTIAVIIALMRMRAVVLPLDGKLPSPRLIAMLEAAQCGLVICERLGGDIDLPRMGFDDLTSQTGYAAPIEFSYLGHHDTAAIYFTSGSTGEPKAVLTSFTGIANFFNFLDAQCGLNDKDVVVQIPTLAFDASLRDSIYPLTKGAKCVLLDPDRAGDPEHLLRMMSLHRATALMSITPSFLTALTEVWHQDCSISPIPRMILASGEKLSAGLLNSVRRWHPDLIFINLYGPTECTMTSTFFPVSCDFNEAVVPVGTPIANGTVHVLDSEMQETPIGVTGEIFIGGAGLASGYLSRADLTAERFVANPFPEGGRLYRTGDRGRWRDDGQLVFIERIDQQIKIRGQRVEPAEIELALTRHPLVSQAFVILREYGDNSARLLAYIILVYGADIDSRALRTFLRETLPDYMIPSAFIPMRAFPLTLNGKLDKASLPDPFPAAPKGARPTTAMEQVVAGVWCDVLKVASVGVDDSFFELGGHSISAARMVALMRDKLGADIPLRIVFDRQTLGSFSESAIPFLPERLRSIAEQSV